MTVWHHIYQHQAPSPYGVYHAYLPGFSHVPVSSCSHLHLRLSIFFASSRSKDYNEGLLALWNATTLFLESVFGIEHNLLPFATNYVLQMIIASGFTLLKLLNSFFAAYVDLEYGRSLFTKSIRAIRTISVQSNDLPSRLAEVLSQLWKSSGAGSKRPEPTSSLMDNSLQLKVKCRMSMSLVFDSVWRWREEFQAQGRGNLEGTKSLSRPLEAGCHAELMCSCSQKPHKPRLKHRELWHFDS